jgi:hypothetical protein
MAAPIVSDFRVVGLLEIFSPHPRAFTKAHETVLDRLVEMIPKTHCEKTQPEKPQPEMPIRSEAVSSVSQPPVSELDSTESGWIHATREALWDPRLEVHEQVSQHVPGQVVSKRVPERVPKPASTAPSRLFDRALLGVTIVVAFVVLGYLVGPMIDKRWADSAQASQRSVADVASTGSGQGATDHSPQAKILTDLRNLADQGDADGQWQMGARYHNGEGVPHDDAQAMQWFLRAAEQGHVTAQATLGAYYWEGRGVPQDLSKAYLWSAIALTEGDMNSKSRLEGLASRMTQEQVSDTLQQAEVWIRTHSQRAKSKAN